MSDHSDSSNDEKDDEFDENDDFDINNLISEVDLKFIMNNLPPDYREVCPPTYKESFYYPSLNFEIAPNLYDEDVKLSDKVKLNLPKQKKVKGYNKIDLNETETHDLTVDNDKSYIKLQAILKNQNDFIEESENFATEIFDFYSSFSILNKIIESNKQKLIEKKSNKITDKLNISKKKSKDFVNVEKADINIFNEMQSLLINQFTHKIEEFDSEEYLSNDLVLLKKELNMDLINLKDLMIKYCKFKINK